MADIDLSKIYVSTQLSAGDFQAEGKAVRPSLHASRFQAGDRRIITTKSAIYIRSLPCKVACNGISVTGLN